MEQLKTWKVWDSPTRWFHWINALCVIALAALGLAILNAGTLGVTSAGKITLKTLHAWVGYLFTVNLLWRIVWAFLGNRYAQWRTLLPGGSGYVHAVRSYISAFLGGHPEQYAGHNPVARIGIATMLLLMLIQAATGLLLTGTDLFFPPFGHLIAQWIAAPGVDPATLAPYAPEMYNKTAYDSMRAMRKPYASLHLYGFYALMGVTILHVAAVIITEVREGGSIISAMFTGRKILRGRPIDDVETGLR